MTTLPEFSQKSHTCPSFDAVLKFLTFCEVVLGDANAVTRKKLFNISPRSTFRKNIKKGWMLVTC